ncbi:uncharacterized protein DNG_04557 [Cephalotrichum gorgonifer]|uniref:Heterokaryon incompatibility domain-containing protein n=1 Tax=Cephalotrichum gorgonifer TaxID=2041049 RepID=A0AAE8MYD6_9PEZI|nr:uncharacterized protein DNG_04557 [Cephalotrichum gorgonifer]
METLCTVCEDLASRLSKEPEFSSQIPGDFNSLEERAAAGCAFCRLLRLYLVYGTQSNVQKLRAGGIRGLHIAAAPEYILAWSPLPEDPAVVVWPRLDLYLGGQTSYHDETPVSPSSEVDDVEPRSQRVIHALDHDGGLDNLIGIAQRWISTCLGTHRECNIEYGAAMRPPNPPQRVAPLLPTRVIDVGDGPGPPSPRLYTRASNQHRAEYFALSYTWGVGMFPARMTKSNLSSMTQGIDMASLPQTVQDAIIFTKRMGLSRYLWVDALCIIQTEGKGAGAGRDGAHVADWAVESSKFGEYYYNALCTLAATGTTCSTDGLFLHRPGLEYAVQPLSLHRYHTEDDSLREMTIEPQFPSWLDSIAFAPLLSRGWTVQERAMSMRILHFARDCVLWECCATRASEYCPSRIQEDDERGMIAGYVLMNLLLTLECEDDDKINVHWFDLVTMYILCEFTFFSDRLSALSGVARRIHDLTGKRYLAGLWEGTLEHGVVWYIKIPDSAAWKAETGNYIAPSWSWASIRGAASMYFLYQDHNGDGSDIPTLQGDWLFPLEVLHADTELTGPDPMGPVRGGRLRMRGQGLQINVLDGFWGDWEEKRQGLTNVATLGAKNGDMAQSVFELYLDDTLSSRRDALSSIFCLLAAVEDSDEAGRRAAGIALGDTGRERGGVKEYMRLGLISAPLSCFRDNTPSAVVDIV